MKLATANEHFNAIANIPFAALFSEDTMNDIIRDKGRAGKLLERALGLANTSATLDFEDGEMKTNKCDINGNPLETIAITQISSHIDDLISMVDFYDTWLYRKISNMLYIPVCREGNPKDWVFLPSIHIDLRDEKYKNIVTQLRIDYENICKQIKAACDTGKPISTINGKYLQIRTKDTTPYHPITSKFYNHILSDKNRAFYFRKDFIVAIKNLI